MPQGLTPAGLGFIRASKPWSDSTLIVEADVIGETDGNSTSKHNSVKLSNSIVVAYRKCRILRRRLRRVLHFRIYAVRKTGANISTAQTGPTRSVTIKLTEINLFESAERVY